MDASFPFTPAAQVVAGLLILILGRRLFWVFVGVIGFFFGLQFGMDLFKGMTPWILLLLSVVVGLVCSGLAVLLERVSVAIAGGFAGGMLAIRLAPLAGLHAQENQWMVFVAGFLLAAVLVTVLFDPALIFLSAITGAVMVAEALPLDATVQLFVILALFVVGVLVQMRIGSGRKIQSG